MKVFYPIVIVINFLSRLLLRIFGIKSEYVNQELLTKDEIKLIVKYSKVVIKKAIIKGVPPSYLVYKKV